MASSFGGFTNNVGGRVATALVDGVLGGGGSPYIPTRGLLVTDADVYFITSGGDHISYAQLAATNRGILQTSGGDNFVTDGGDTIIALENVY